MGIGASAGGLEALKDFFEHLPPDSGIAFIVILHLDPNKAGYLSEVLQRYTTMTVTQAKNRQIVKPDCIYVIPPNKSITLSNGKLRLDVPVFTHGLRLPVDVFFHSLALERGEKSIGIVLSGMGNDGNLGLKVIKEKHGIVLVQDPESARYDSMPKSAIQSVTPDAVAHAQDLPSKLLALLRPAIPEPEDLIRESTHESTLKKILMLLLAHTGHDFSMYKNNTLYRRIDRRKSVYHLEHLDAYLEFIQQNPGEMDILFKELLIGVTSFFRDPDLWVLLKESLLPELIDTLAEGHLIRAWVAGCSTGEEAYSLAIVFHELLEESGNPKNLSLQIFATDLDCQAIEKARKGIFNRNISHDVSPERLSRFFSFNNKEYCVTSSIRDMIVFAVQSVIKDPPFTRLDVLSCRNLLIYMKRELQAKVLNLLHYSLSPGGLLVLGNSESTEDSCTGLKGLNTKSKVFIKSNCGQPGSVALISDFSIQKISKNSIKKEFMENQTSIQSIADNIILHRHSPASVLVNENGDIVYITGRTGKYLEPVSGKVNWNIHAMARSGLSQILPKAFRDAMKSRGEVTVSHVQIGLNGGSHYVDVIVQKMDQPDLIKGMILVVFKDLGESVLPDRKKGSLPKRNSSDREKELETELQQCIEELKNTRESMKRSQEELKSANEELQSTNEELQSTNEELTTSKEEMQSLNEELETVNSELQIKVSDYVRSNDDMKNLLNSTEIATLFLDRNLNIRRFTDKVSNIFMLRTSDIGRPFTDLVTRLNYADILNDALNVLDTLVSMETETQTNDSRWLSVRIMPYRTIDDHIDGLVITFADITSYKAIETKLGDAIQALHKNISSTEAQ